MFPCKFIHSVNKTATTLESCVDFHNSGEKNVSLCSWNSRTAERGKLLALGHNSIARMISHSPTQSAFLSCSDDFRARFWFYKQTQP